jgi:hypothetical protein
MREPERMAARRLREPTGVRPRVRRSLRSALGVKTLSWPSDKTGGACVVGAAAAAAAVVAATCSQAGAEVEKARADRPRSAREVDAIVCVRVCEGRGRGCVPEIFLMLQLEAARASPRVAAKPDFFVSTKPARPTRKAPPHRSFRLCYPHTHTMATRRALVTCARWKSAPSVCPPESSAQSSD